MLSLKDFFSKCDQIGSFLQIWSHLLKKSLIENLGFGAVIFSINITALQVFSFELWEISQNIFFRGQLLQFLLSSGVLEQFGLKKFHLKNHWNFLGFFAYIQLFNNKKRADFNPIGAVFSRNYSDTPHVYTTSIALKLYTTQIVSVPRI